MDDSARQVMLARSTDISRACIGTDGDDRITGSDTRDEIDAFDGGDLRSSSGGRRHDNLYTGEFPGTKPVVDTVRGGSGNDGIGASGGYRDFIDRSTGTADLRGSPSTRRPVSRDRIPRS